MRLPKTVQICGKKYNVRKDGSMWGGHGLTGKQEIVVGTAKNQTTHRKFQNYIHEVAELITCEQFTRYEANDEEIVFVMNHKQFDQFANHLATALLPMVKR